MQAITLLIALSQVLAGLHIVDAWGSWWPIVPAWAAFVSFYVLDVDYLYAPDYDAWGELVYACIAGCFAGMIVGDVEYGSYLAAALLTPPFVVSTIAWQWVNICELDLPIGGLLDRARDGVLDVYRKCRRRNDILQFITESFESAGGMSVTGEDVLITYWSWCATQNIKPVEDDKFLTRFTQTVGIVQGFVMSGDDLRYGGINFKRSVYDH